MNIKELVQASKIPSMSRGRSIAASLGFMEPLSEEQANAIVAVSGIMSTEGLRVTDAVKRYQQTNTGQASDSNFTDQVHAANQQSIGQVSQELMTAVDAAAQTQAAGLLYLKDMLVMRYASNPNLLNLPGLQDTLKDSATQVEAVILGTIPVFTPESLLRSLTGGTLFPALLPGQPSSTQTTPPRLNAGSSESSSKK